jgi:hypothetical protein
MLFFVNQLFFNVLTSSLQYLLAQVLTGAS